jgi:hypothetical protein
MKLWLRKGEAAGEEAEGLFFLALVSSIHLKNFSVSTLLF